MAYQSNLLGDFWTSYRQRRATGGRPLTSAEMRGLLDPVMGADAQKAIAAGERQRLQENFNRQMTLQEKAAADQARAASVGGATQLLGLGVGGYLGYKNLGIAAQQAQATNNMTAALLGGGGGGAATMSPALGSAYSAATTGAANFLGGSAPALGAGAANAAPVLAGPTSFGTPSMLAAEGAGTTAPAAAGAGVGSYLLPAMPGVLASQMKGLSDVEQGAVGALGGGIVGAATLGATLGGPLGFVVGAGIGLIGSLFDDIF